MPTASTTSPFLMEEHMPQPWLMWTQKEPLTRLIQEKQTDSRYVLSGETDEILKEKPVSVPEHPLKPQTNRYNAVLSRMDVARKHAAGFSAWNN